VSIFRRALVGGLGVAAVVGAAVAFGAGAPAEASGLSHPGQAHYGVKLLHHSASALSKSHAAVSADTLSLTTSIKPGAVSPNPKVYLVFWGKQWSTKDPAGVATDLQNLFKGLYGGQDTWGTILSQYCEGLKAGTTTCGTSGTHIVHPSASPLAGVWFDNHVSEPGSPSATQIGNEAIRAAGHFGNRTQTPNDNAQYVIVSATGTHPDGFNTPSGDFCAWHDSTASNYGTLAYTNLPYVPDEGVDACTTLSDGRLLSGIESTETHEYAETVTDFWPTNGWNNNANGEIGDECINLDAFVKLSTGSFDLQGLWSNAANKCVTHG
jgi:serine protease